MYNGTRRSLSHIVFLAVLFFYISLATGCGLVADGVNHVRAIQLPPGDLYSPEFYAAATPEEVKAAIGGRSLAEESFTERYYAANTEGRGFLADLDGKIKSVQSVFVPMSSVDEGTPLYPLQVAVAHTPHPEVITLLLDAGAKVERVSVPRYVASHRSDPAISKVLIARASPPVQCESLMAAARRGDMQIVEYCLGLEGVSAACSVGKDYPLKSALLGGQVPMARYLLERGAALPQDADGKLELLGITLRTRGYEAFGLLTGLGLECSLVRADGKNSLMTVAADAGVDDAAVLGHLAQTVPLDAPNAGAALLAACKLGNMDVLDTLLRRNGGLPGDGASSLEMLETALRRGHGEVFWKLVAKGADASLVDASDRNDLMGAAAWNSRPDAKIAGYLALHVPVEGRNGNAALRYAVQMGYAAPVRTLLERGAVPGRPELTLRADAPEYEAVRTVLAERNVPCKIR